MDFFYTCHVSCEWKAGMEGEGLWEGEWYPITNIKIENQHRRIVEISPKS